MRKTKIHKEFCEDMKDDGRIILKLMLQKHIVAV
jgi:hypothetical protein